MSITPDSNGNNQPTPAGAYNPSRVLCLAAACAGITAGLTDYQTATTVFVAVISLFAFTFRAG
jgi:hypothetical protein